MTNTTATATKTARDEFLSDLLITAVAGGVNYWANVTAIDPGVYRLDEYEGTDTHQVDVTTVRRGINRILKDPAMVSQSAARIIGKASRTNDGCNLDAALADMIVQAGLFDQPIYG